MTVLMVGVSVVGFAAASTNLMFIFARKPSPVKWQKEHVKSLVGTGISVYTAFLAFGAVRLMPSLALHPVLWAVPLVIGLTIMIYHMIRIDQKAGLGVFQLVRRRGLAGSEWTSPTYAGQRVVVVGAGMGRLAAAADLARAGADVHRVPKRRGMRREMRQVMAGTDPAKSAVDGGPTVFTMRWIFDGLFGDAGERVEDHLGLIPAETLARHAWRQGGRLDLLADIARSADAIGTAGAADARAYRTFCARSRDIYRTLAKPFIASERPSPLDLVARVGLRQMPDMWRACRCGPSGARLAMIFAIRACANCLVATRPMSGHRRGWLRPP